MHYNACAENAFESSCGAWWTKIAAVPFFLGRTWPLNQYIAKINIRARRLRYYRNITLPRAKSTILTYLKKDFPSV